MRNPSEDEQLILGNLSLNFVSESNSSNKSLAKPSQNGTKSTIRIDTTSPRNESQDEDDYDLLEIDPATVLRGSKGGGLQEEPTLDIPQGMNLGTQYKNIVGKGPTRSSPYADSSARPAPSGRRQSFSIKLEKTSEKGRYILKADDPELRDILRSGLQREAEINGAKKRSRFSDLVFTRQFTAFDRQNSESSPFRGFFTLFWLGTFLMLVKLAAENWKVYGSIFGRNEILAMMFHRDVLLLGITDGIICFCTVFCLLLQRLILAGYISWNGSGWIIQNVRYPNFPRSLPPISSMLHSRPSNNYKLCQCVCFCCDYAHVAPQYRRHDFALIVIESVFLDQDVF